MSSRMVAVGTSARIPILKGAPATLPREDMPGARRPSLRNGVTDSPHTPCPLHLSFTEALVDDTAFLNNLYIFSEIIFLRLELLLNSFSNAGKTLGKVSSTDPSYCYTIMQVISS